MSSPADLSKLRINRDAPAAPVRKALGRNLIIFAVAIAIIAGVVFTLKMRAVPTIQVTTAATTGTASSASGGATSVNANGYVVARTKASVSAKIAGRLAFLGVSEGSFVHRGDIIARLDNADLLAAVSQARANIASAQASVLETSADRDQLTREAARAGDIRKSDSTLLSSQDYESSVSRAAQADARFSAANARKQSAEAALQLAEATNDNTIIRAPFTGTVLRKDAEVGEVVAPSVGGGLTRGAVVTMADLETLEVEVDVNESYIGRIANGQAARITLDAYPDTTFRGVTRQVVPTADRQRATVQVKVTITDHDPRILPEMGAKVDFLVPEAAHGSNAAVTTAARQAIRVPEAAVKTDSGSTVVFIVRDGRLVRRVVTTGPVSGGFFEIRAGLSGGEQLYVGGVDAPTNGMRVKVK
jgi:HlyD family secretion protein